MTDKLNDNDRQRIEQVSIEICGNRSEDGLERVRFQDGAEYATLFERQRQQLPPDNETVEDGGGCYVAGSREEKEQLIQRVNELELYLTLNSGDLAEQIQKWEAERTELRNKVIELEKLIASDSVYTLLRFGNKNPSYSGVDDCEEERLYQELYNISRELRNSLKTK